VHHLGNNTISVASGTTIVHVGRGVNSGGVGNNAVSVTSGASVVVVRGHVGGDDVGEGIHLSLFDVERVLVKRNGEKHTALYTRESLFCAMHHFAITTPNSKSILRQDPEEDMKIILRRPLGPSTTIRWAGNI
jgi:hypothetical protein